MSAPTGGGHAEPRCSCGRAFRTIAPDGGICEAGHFIKRDARGLLPSAAAPPGDRSAPPAADHRRTAGRLALGLLCIADVRPEPVPWLWPARVALGKIAMLAGQPGVGKSTVTLDIAARLSRGDAMPDGTRGDIDGPAATILLTGEDGIADTIAPRLAAAGADLARVFAFETIRDTGQDGQPSDERPPTIADLDELHAAIIHTGAKLVIVDPVMSFLPARIDGLNQQDTRRVLTPLGKLAEALGVAILMVNHLTKSGQGAAYTRPGGSIAFIAAARTASLIAADPDDAEGRRRVLAEIKNNISPTALSLSYRLRPTDGGVAVVEWEGVVERTADQLLQLPADGDERSAATDARAFLLDYLADGSQPADRVLRAAKEAGVAERTLKRAKAALGVESVKESRGLVGGWRWALPKAATALEGCQPSVLAPFEGDWRPSSGELPKDANILEGCQPLEMAPFGDLGTLRAASRVDGATDVRCPGGCGRPGDAGHPTGRCWFCRAGALVGGAR